MVDRTHRELTDGDMARIACSSQAWRRGEEEGSDSDVSGSCKSAAVDEMRERGPVLAPGGHLGMEHQEDDGEPCEDKLERPVAELREQRAEGAKRNAATAKNLRVLGFQYREVGRWPSER